LADGADARLDAGEGLPGLVGSAPVVQEARLQQVQPRLPAAVAVLANELVGDGIFAGGVGDRIAAWMEPGGGLVGRGPGLRCASDVVGFG
jgi:hypothetical protein